MSDIPIMFSDGMVCAIRDDYKSQTRRIVSRGNSITQCSDWDQLEFDESKVPADVWAKAFADNGYLHIPTRPHPDDPQEADHWTRERVYPRREVGDRLWVREGVRQITQGIVGKNGQYKWPTFVNADKDARDWFKRNCYYTADHPGREDGRSLNKMFMPRWASRFLLEITSVRVERAQSISEADAAAEGVAKKFLISARVGDKGRDERMPNSYRCGFRLLWESINGKESWDANPWVWCYAFRKVDAAGGWAA